MAATYQLDASAYRRGIRDAASHLVAAPLFLWVAALSAVAFCLRIVDLGSVPEWFTDEGFWTMAPRDFVLFADWAPTAYFHHYLSPFFSGLLAVWFRLLGPGILQGRLLDSVIGVITIVLVVVLGARLGSAKVGLLAAAALAFDGPFTITNRSVLLESAQSLLIVACALVSVYESRRAYPLLALLFAAALLTKALSIYIAPLLIGYAWYRAGRRGAMARSLALVGGALIAVSVFGAIALVDLDHFVTTWSGEFAVRGRAVSFLSGGEGSLRTTAGYFLSREALLLIGSVGSVVWLATRRAGPATTYLAIWTLVGVLAMALQGYSPPRYFVPLLPFAWLWVLFTLREVRAAGMFRRWGSWVVVGALAAQVVYAVGAGVVYYYLGGHRDSSSGAFVNWANASLTPGEAVLGPFRLVVSTRVPARGWEALPHDVWLTPHDLRASGIEFVVTADDTRSGPWPNRLQLVQEVERGASGVAQFGDIRVYRLVD